MIHAIRLRTLTEQEVEQARLDGVHCLQLDVPNQCDNFWHRWAVLEIVNDLGEWHRVHIEMTF